VPRGGGGADWKDRGLLQELIRLSTAASVMYSQFEIVGLLARACPWSISVPRNAHALRTEAAATAGGLTTGRLILMTGDARAWKPAVDYRRTNCRSHVRQLGDNRPAEPPQSSELLGGWEIDDSAMSLPPHPPAS